MYTIPGYHITRIKSVPGLSLKKWLGPRYIKNENMTVFQQCAELINTVNNLEETVSNQGEEFRLFMDEFNDIIKSIGDDISSAMRKCDSLSADRKQQESLSEMVTSLKKQVDSYVTYPKLREHVKEIDKDLDKMQEQLKTLFDAFKDDYRLG
jgi:uncharacterized coiled-coil protein SlyX